MIRNAVIHIHNEQPLMADLLAMPTPTDVTLVCTNLRTMNGERPVFIDRIESVFVFPMIHVRFVEIAPGTADETDLDLPARTGRGRGEPAPGPEDEIDEELLRRIREA